MTTFRILITTIAMGASALAQTVPPAPPAPPAPLVSQAPPAPPAPFIEPFAVFDDQQLADLQLSALDAQNAANDARLFANGLLAQVSPNLAPRPARVAVGVGPFAYGNDDAAYSAGQRALDNHQWDQALNNFSRVTSGAKADGALYWKAYTLNKLNRRDDAQAAIVELRKSYASSRWLEDASALELQIRQASGQAVAPESESDEELKLLALNGIMQSDPDRALPLIESLLKSTQSPKLKKNAVFVLTQSNSPKARTLLEQIARGGNNPDLQVTAINYIATQRRGQTNSGDLLWEIYNSSNDVSVKRQILNSFSSSNDRDHLLQVARSEKNTELRLAAIQHIGGASFPAELWQIYQSETSPDIKRSIISTMSAAGNADRLQEIARTEKDAGLRRMAIQQLASGNASGDWLVTLYSSEQDVSVRQSIIDILGSRNNAKALVTMAKSEHDPKMLNRIVQRLSTMKSPEATAYFEELLKR